jgi:hypothetical protein
MRYIILFLLIITLWGCKNKEKTFQPMADSIKQYFLKEIPGIKSVDTMYILIDTITPRKKSIIQSAAYRWAWTEAKKNNSPDSTSFKNISDSIIDNTAKLSDKIFLYYRVRPLIIFTDSNSGKKMAEKWFYFDKEFMPVQENTFVIKVAKTDNDKLVIEDYKPLTPAENKGLTSIGMLKY